MPKVIPYEKTSGVKFEREGLKKKKGQIQIKDFGLYENLVELRKR